MYVPGAVFILHIHCFGPTRSPIRRYVSFHVLSLLYLPPYYSNISRRVNTIFARIAAIAGAKGGHQRITVRQ